MRFIAKRWLFPSRPVPSRPDLAKPLAPSIQLLAAVGLQAKSSAVSATNWRRDNDNDNDDNNDDDYDNDNSQLATSSFCRQRLLKCNAPYFLKIYRELDAMWAQGTRQPRNVFKWLSNASEMCATLRFSTIDKSIWGWLRLRLRLWLWAWIWVWGFCLHKVQHLLVVRCWFLLAEGQEYPLADT